MIQDNEFKDINFKKKDQILKAKIILNKLIIILQY